MAEGEEGRTRTRKAKCQTDPILDRSIPLIPDTAPKHSSPASVGSGAAPLHELPLAV